MPNQVKMLAHRYMQAFSLDWVFFRWSKKKSYILSLDWAFLKICPIKGKCLRIIHFGVGSCGRQNVIVANTVVGANLRSYTLIIA